MIPFISFTLLISNTAIDGDELFTNKFKPTTVTNWLNVSLPFITGGRMASICGIPVLYVSFVFLCANLQASFSASYIEVTPSVSKFLLPTIPVNPAEF